MKITIMKDLIENINKDVRGLIYLEIHKFKLKKIHPSLIDRVKIRDAAKFEELYSMAISYNALRIMSGLGGLAYQN